MKQSRNRGFIETIVVIVLAIALLSYFGINLRQFFNSPLFRENFSYVWNGAQYLWIHYLRTPTLWVWSFVWSLIKPGLELLLQHRATP